MVEHDPEVAAHFAKLHVLPEVKNKACQMKKRKKSQFYPSKAFTQRWFLALGVNVLPYSNLLDLIDAFFAEGTVVLHRLGLAIVSCVFQVQCFFLKFCRFASVA